MTTKKEMIEKMQELEAQANKTLDYYIEAYGYENESTTCYLWRWGAIFELMEQFGIEVKREEA